MRAVKREQSERESSKRMREIKKKNSERTSRVDKSAAESERVWCVCGMCVPRWEGAAAAAKADGRRARQVESAARLVGSKPAKKVSVGRSGDVGRLDRRPAPRHRRQRRCVRSGRSHWPTGARRPRPRCHRHRANVVLRVEPPRIGRRSAVGKNQQTVSPSMTGRDQSFRP